MRICKNVAITSRLSHSTNNSLAKATTGSVTHRHLKLTVWKFGDIDFTFITTTILFAPNFLVSLHISLFIYESKRTYI